MTTNSNPDGIDFTDDTLQLLAEARSESARLHVLQHHGLTVESASAVAQRSAADGDPG